MGLDIYVGSLTRYYLQDWETVVERLGRESGTPVEVVRSEVSAEDAEEALTDPNEIRETVDMWRDAVSSALDEHLTEALTWDESSESPYFTEKPTWDCYSALLLWAAYSEQPELERPTANVEDWNEDPAYQKSSDAEFDTDYGALLRGTSTWLPSDFAFTFVSEDLTGEEACFGSSVQLMQQLFDLNAKTWQADEATIAQWRAAGCEADAPLEDGAKFGFAVFYEMARQAAKHKLVMKLDY